MSATIRPHRVTCAHGEIAWREAGSGPALVLLHGIGSCAQSWNAQLSEFAATHRVLAWDAPGYGGSAPLPMAQPQAADYAAALADWLQRIEVRSLALVGHSLGALMAGAYAASTPSGLEALVLASPARGYAMASAEARDAKWRERVTGLERLGLPAFAAERAPRLCAPGTAPELVAQVRDNMLQITPGGYAQAAWMLSNDDLLDHLRRVKLRSTVLCGTLDTVTPLAACETIAAAVNAPCRALPGVGHACYVENAAQFNAALRGALAEVTSYG